MAARKEITKATRLRLYGAARQLTNSAKEELGVRIPFDVYLQDPLVADENPMVGIESDLVRWEPGLADGPTSARFAVVDYNNDTGHLAPLAKWDEESGTFCDSDLWILDRNNSESLQFDQVNVWALLQRALEFFEEGAGLGRPVPFGFEGNRLIVVPHAGYGENAFYDRESKSLQFYYFDDADGNRVDTCLSSDIVNHEFGHAVLDGVRPYFYESASVETGAFHEFMGDLTAILLLLRNNTYRGRISRKSGSRLSEAEQLNRIGEQFGESVSDKPYLRTAQNDKTMDDVSDASGPHEFSEVLTGAMYDILIAFSDNYVATPLSSGKQRSAKQAFWSAIQRMQRVAIQPLDLLPPVDVTFRDYALAVLRAEEIANPTDPKGYLQMMLKIFVKRKILSRADAAAFNRPRYVFDRLRVDVKHSIGDIARSRAAAYRFLDDNREKLYIPPAEDIIIADLYDTNKTTRQGLRMPRQVVLEYIWREEVALDGPQFGEFDGQVTTMPCGGTLVFNENGNVLSWTRKPGTGGKGRHWTKERAEGRKRRDSLLADLAIQITAGHVGAMIGGGKGMLGTRIPPLTARKEAGLLRFALAPHMHIVGEDHEHYEGGSKWEISS